MRFLIFSVLSIGFLSFTHAGPVEEVKAISGFDEIEVEKLAEGDIKADQLRVDNLSRGIAAQACFLVNEDFATVSKRLEKWETSHVKPSAPFFHKDLTKGDEETFSSLNLSSNGPGVSWLVEKAKDTKPNSSDLNLSLAEAARVSEIMGKGGSEAEQASRAWRWILAGRARGFLEKGMKGLAPLETTDETVQPSIEIDELISGIPEIKQHFGELLHQVLFSPGSTKDQSFYWELMKGNEHANFNLGTIAYTREGESFKAVNCDYYISSETFVSCTVYQLWPLEVGGKPSTLVWRGEFASSPRLENAKGVERMAAKKIMLNDLRKEIGFFKKLGQ